MALGLALASPAPADESVSRLQLRAEASVTGDFVRLNDVLVLAGAEPRLVEQIGDQPVGAGPGEPAPSVVTRDQVIRRLDELGVNLARVLVSGAVACQIARRTAPPNLEEPPPRTEAHPGAEPHGERTLAEALRTHVDRELRSLGGSAELVFERAGQEFLRLTSPPWEFDITSQGRGKLGLREFRVAIHQNGQLQRKVQVLAQVRLVRTVVVARRPLNPGNLVRADDLGLEARVFEQETQLGLSTVAEAVGQQIRQFVPVGQMVPAEAVKRGDLVSRSRPVTVVSSSGPVQVRLSGMALDSGGYGDTVRVRMGDARGAKRVLQGVVAGLGTVRLAEGPVQ